MIGRPYGGADLTEHHVHGSVAWLRQGKAGPTEVSPAGVVASQ